MVIAISILVIELKLTGYEQILLLTQMVIGLHTYIYRAKRFG